MANSLIFSRINLSKTNYTELDSWAHIKRPDIDHLNEIYKKYCRYKKFASVKPIFKSEYLDPNSDVIGYYDNNQLVAFSIIKIYDAENIECLQFVWDYANPKLRLGIRSLENECALYKRLGYQYMYLGGADEYKAKIAGFEILGKL